MLRLGVRRKTFEAFKMRRLVEFESEQFLGTPDVSVRDESSCRAFSGSWFRDKVLARQQQRALVLL
jgi:hypothetical protein